MKLRINPETVVLDDPEVFTAFSVSCPADLTEPQLRDLLARNGIGEVVAGGEHLMVSVAALRTLSAGRVGPDWEDSLAGMLAYAGSKGWLSDDGDLVRAHIERVVG